MLASSRWLRGSRIAILGQDLLEAGRARRCTLGMGLGVTQMHNAKRAVLLFATVVLVACAGQVKTNTSYDETVNFASYKTFAQTPPPSYAANLPGYSEITGRNIQDRISMTLQQKGLEPAGMDEADLQVSFTLGGQERQEAEYFTGWGWYGPGEFTTENYVEGSLVIQMGDRARKRLVWHGYGVEDVFSGDVNQEDVMKAVDAVLANYPPAQGTAAK